MENRLLVFLLVMHNMRVRHFFVMAGTYHVILDETHYKELLMHHVSPPPASSTSECSLIRMGRVWFWCKACKPSVFSCLYVLYVETKQVVRSRIKVLCDFFFSKLAFVLLSILLVISCSSYKVAGFFFKK